MKKRVSDMTEAELSAHTTERRQMRKLRLRKTPTRRTVKALATAWRCEEKVLEKLVSDVLESK